MPGDDHLRDLFDEMGSAPEPSSEDEAAARAALRAAIRDAAPSRRALWRRPALLPSQRCGSGSLRRDRWPTLGMCVRSESAPDPESRVTLAPERDALGARRARLDWRLGELDATSIRRALETFGRALSAAGRGRARLALRDDAPWHGARGGEHHMGTTRMSRSAGRGVVDPHCRVHGVANLYVAGSSVFPTVGFSNPTLTIVALVLRLADRLKRERAR